MTSAMTAHAMMTVRSGDPSSMVVEEEGQGGESDRGGDQDAARQSEMTPQTLWRGVRMVYEYAKGQCNFRQFVESERFAVSIASIIIF
jgi:hypothetical protein